MQRLRAVGYLSFVKFATVAYALAGVAYGALYAGFIFLFGAAAAMGGGEEAALVFGGGALGALAALVLIPILFAAIGLLVGLIGGFVLNLALKLSGGIELELG